MAFWWELLGDSGKNTVLSLDALPCKHALQDGMNMRKPRRDALFPRSFFIVLIYSAVNPLMTWFVNVYMVSSGNRVPHCIHCRSIIITHYPHKHCHEWEANSHFQRHPNIIWLVNWIRLYIPTKSLLNGCFYIPHIGHFICVLTSTGLCGVIHAVLLHGTPGALPLWWNQFFRPHHNPQKWKRGRAWAAIVGI